MTEQQIQEELDNAFNQVDADRRAPPMENQHEAVQEQEEQILADYSDQDESDGDVELNDISFSCAGSPRISIIDGEVGDSQPIVWRDLLVELANEEQRFEFREDLENDDWRVPSTYAPSTYFPSVSPCWFKWHAGPLQHHQN